MMEDDDDEDDNVSFDLLPLANTLHSAPSKGRSPAHRQIRHQRNARRILDSWMADDDPSQSRSDGKNWIFIHREFGSLLIICSKNGRKILLIHCIVSLRIQTYALFFKRIN